MWLCIYNWNPGPRRGKQDAFEKQIAGRWHITTLQEASEYVDHDILASRFHVTHSAGCAINFNKDTTYTNVDVKSIYLHDTRLDLPDQVMEGEQGWVRQGVLSRASFRRPAVSVQKYFTVLSLHISNNYATKKGIAKKLIVTLRAIMTSQEVDLVACDFIGAAWQWRRGHKAGFLNPRGSERFWKVCKHGAFSIPRISFGRGPTDQRCHNETWLHLNFVDWNNTGPRKTRITLKERTKDEFVKSWETIRSRLTGVTTHTLLSCIAVMPSMRLRTSCVEISDAISWFSFRDEAAIWKKLVTSSTSEHTLSRHEATGRALPLSWRLDFTPCTCVPKKKKLHVSVVKVRTKFWMKRNHDRTGQPVVTRNASHDSGNEQSMLNEVEIDFRILGLLHSVVKQAESSRVRELVKKIEYHPQSTTKTMPTNRSVRRPRKWSRTWAT